MIKTIHFPESTYSFKIARILVGRFVISAIVSIFLFTVNVDGVMAQQDVPILAETGSRLTFLDHDRNPLEQAVETILTRAYSALGILIDVKFTAPKRALQYNNSGIFDGELFRVPGIEVDYPNLVKVPVELGYVDFVAYSMRRDLSVKHWNDLAAYRVGAQLGVTKIEQESKDLKVSWTPTLDGAFMMLAADRVDVVVASRLVACEHLLRLKKQNPKLEAIREIAVLEHAPIYHYLTRTHTHLVPLLAQELDTLRRDGFIAATFETMERKCGGAR